MKTYTLNTPSASILNQFPAFLKRLEATLEARRTGVDPAAPPGAALTLSLGGDLEKAGACFAAQIEAQTPLPLGTLSREDGAALVRECVRRGLRVVVTLEACGFGWAWQRELRALGAVVFTVAPEALCGRRKTNRRDAAALARIGMERVVHGDAKSGRVVREPSQPEQQRRSVSRIRGKLISLRGRLEGMGRGLLLDSGIIDYPDTWWGKKMWPQLQTLLLQRGESFLHAELSELQKLAQHLHTRIRALDAQLATIAQQVTTTPLPAGLGEATATLVNLEVCDWQRFHNRKQAGSFTGCCPSERSTGTGQTQGGIDRLGNRRIRSALTEAIWRLKRREPTWHGFQKWGHVLFEAQTSSVRKKKAIMACVRLLFIDLWRLNTGKVTLAQLGFRGRPQDAPDATEAPSEETDCEAASEAPSPHCDTNTAG